VTPKQFIHYNLTVEGGHYWLLIHLQSWFG